MKSRSGKGKNDLSGFMIAFAMVFLLILISILGFAPSWINETQKTYLGVGIVIFIGFFIYLILDVLK